MIETKFSALNSYISENALGVEDRLDLVLRPYGQQPRKEIPHFRHATPVAPTIGTGVGFVKHNACGLRPIWRRSLIGVSADLTLSAGPPAPAQASFARQTN